MSKSHRDAVIDFAVGLPEIAAKAMTPSNIKKGFLENGTIDQGNFRSPDFWQIQRGLQGGKLYPPGWTTFLHLIQIYLESSYNQRTPHA
jgi:hypothetical protein